MGKEARGWAEFFVFKCIFDMLQVEEKNSDEMRGNGTSLPQVVDSPRSLQRSGCSKSERPMRFENL